MSSENQIVDFDILNSIQFSFVHHFSIYIKKCNNINGKDRSHKGLMAVENTFDQLINYRLTFNLHYQLLERVESEHSGPRQVISIFIDHISKYIQINIS